MCGIAGIINPRGNIAQSDLKRMADSIVHRGPDGEGFWLNETANVGFGFRRLAILDLSEAGSQPMHYAEGRYTIVFNGEIYNFIEIKENLERKGYKFKSHCDTEVLLALYHERKEKCLQDLDGMFAFAIWDASEQKLFCARDRFGEKPFYYALRDGNFYFASEMKALWAAGVPRVVNNRMFFNFLARENLYNPQNPKETFFEGINKLEAAHYFYLSPENLKIEPLKYWEIDYHQINEDISEEEAAEEFRRLFYESVKRRLRSDVPVGSSLSGGLDSSLVVCVIDELKKNQKIPQATFSARFPGFARDEGEYMQAVIDRTLVEPHFVYPDEAGLIENLENLFYHQEEPFNSASIYAQFCVMRLAKENNVTVLLDGQGADELLAGYHFYFADYFSELRKRNKTLWKTEMAHHAEIHSSSPVKFGQKEKIKIALKHVLPATAQTKIRQVKWKANLGQFINQDFLNSYFDDFIEQNSLSPQSLAESLYQTTFYGSLEALLRYADRNSMAHSREVRLPFLSHHLAEFLFSLPPHLKIKNGVTKYIMRKAFADILPPLIVNRQDKIGYEPPQKKWLEAPVLTEKIEQSKNNLTRAGILKSNLKNSNDGLDWKILMADFLTSGVRP
ncbi:MAG TPA: asparagine synthase (glutamine-hydrolyzing) [Pyrinomonadaceae bacterium]|nr:asparagine synthase (glutamine-hydrolyzing) [Pyrinomonadaceae bacterium]